MRYVFGDFELDDTIFELRRGGHAVQLRPQALDVLLLLVRARERVVTREELLDEVWPGTVVSPTALAQAIIAARRALGDDPDEPRIIQTVRARGYRFILPVVEAKESARVPASATVPGAAEGELVGRAEPLGTLEGLSREARAGRGGGALVTGETGVGKTRLVTELATRAAAAGDRVISVRCHDQTAAPPLWPFIQALRELARDADAGAELARHADLAALVHAPPPALAQEAGDAAAQAEFRLFDAMARFLRGVAARRPLLLVLDDMQWADDGSLALTKLVARELGAAAVLLVVVYRSASGGSGAPDSALARTMGALARADARRAVVLGGLSRDEVARLAALRHGRPLSDEAVARIFDKTDGNPLLVTQLLHGLRQDSPGGAVAGATSAMLSTDVMRDAIALHIGELGPACAQMLGVAAVLGRTFTMAALAGTSGADAATLLPLLDEAIGARIVAKIPGGTRPGEHRFVHALVRDVLYRRLAVAERVRLHGAAGDAILSRTPSPEGEALDAVAVHFAEAAAGGDAARAVTWCVRASESAATPEEALLHLERATRAVEHVATTDAATLHDLHDALGALALRAPALAARATQAAAKLPARRA